MEFYRMMLPPKPTLTEKNLEDQTGKVFLITGSSSGVGEQLAKILYQHNAKVYVAVRSEEKAKKAIDGIKAAHPDSKGELVFLKLDLGDLSTIKPTADEFMAKESLLNVLWLNAGVMVPPQGSKTVQGHELQFGTNNLGHFLLVKYLRPALLKAVSVSSAASTRVVWVSSSAAEFAAPKPAIDLSNMDYKREEKPWAKYGRSKAGNVLHAVEFSRRPENEGIISLSLNPGNLKTELQRHVSWVQMLFMKFLLYHPRFGAYTELFAGLSSTIKPENNGAWVQPWGRMVNVRADLLERDIGSKFWGWSEEQVKAF